LRRPGSAGLIEVGEKGASRTIHDGWLFAGGCCASVRERARVQGNSKGTIGGNAPRVKVITPLSSEKERGITIRFEQVNTPGSIGRVFHHRPNRGTAPIGFDAQQKKKKTTRVKPSLGKPEGGGYRIKQQHGCLGTRSSQEKAAGQMQGEGGIYNWVSGGLFKRVHWGAIV